MKFARVTFILLTSILIFQSCTDLKKGGQLSILDDLTKTVDSIEVVLNENRIDTLKNMRDAARLMDERIAELHSSDTLSLTFAMQLDEYKLMVESIPEIEMQQVELKKGVAELHTSISKLRTDISNASGEKNRYDEFLLFEKKKVVQLRDVLNSFVKMRDKLESDYPSVEEEVRNFAFAENK